VGLLYRKRLLRELAKLPGGTRDEVELFAFETLPGSEPLERIGTLGCAANRPGRGHCTVTDTALLDKAGRALDAIPSREAARALDEAARFIAAASSLTSD